MAYGKFIKRDEASHLISERTDVERTIRPIVEAAPEGPQPNDPIKKAKRLVRSVKEGYVFDLALVKQLVDLYDSANKYLVVMRGMDDPNSTVILGVADTINTGSKGIEISVLGDEYALLQHPRGTKISGVTLRKNLVGNDDLELTIETDDNES